MYCHEAYTNLKKSKLNKNGELTKKFSEAVDWSLHILWRLSIQQGFS